MAPDAGDDRRRACAACRNLSSVTLRSNYGIGQFDAQGLVRRGCGRRRRHAGRPARSQQSGAWHVGVAAKLENCFEISYKAIIVFVSGSKSVIYGDSTPENAAIPQSGRGYL